MAIDESTEEEYEYNDSLVVSILTGTLECDKTDTETGLTILQQCIDRQLYNTLKILVQERRADVHYKSSHLEYDALHFAVRRADTCGILLLLELGANINSTDGLGLTPMVWVIINDPYSVCVQRLLLASGCNLQARDPYGNTCLHLLAYRNGINHDLAFMLITANNSSSGSDDNSSSSNDSNSKLLLQSRNNDDHIPFDLARKENNRQLAQLLVEIVQFITWPKYTPFIAAFGLALAYAFLLLPVLGVFYGTIVVSCIGFAAAPLFQTRISRHIQRAYLGVALGYLVVLLTTYAVYIDFHISTFWSRAFYITFITMVLLCYKMHKSKPQSPSLSQGSSTNEFIKALLSTADDYEAVRKVTGEGSGEAKGVAAGDSDTYIDITSGTRPYLCSQCLCDKKLYNVSAHCKYCGICVVGMDQHSFLFSTCVGRGNVRLYFICLVLVLCVFLIYVSLSIQVYNSEHYCNNIRGVLFNSFAVGSCLYSKFPVLFVNIFSAIYMLAGVVIQIASQLFVVANETTISHIIHKKYNHSSFYNKTSYHVSNVVNFLLTGISNNAYVMSYADYLEEDGEVDVYAYKRFNHIKYDRDALVVRNSESDIRKVVEKERQEYPIAGGHNRHHKECCNRAEGVETPLLSTRASTIDYRDR